MRRRVIVDEEEMVDAVADRFFDEMHPYLGDGNVLWGPLAIALATAVKRAVRKGIPFVEDNTEETTP